MKALRISGIALIIIFAGNLRTAVAQNPSIQEELLADWSNLKTTMDKIANEMPDDKYDFAPPASLGEFKGVRTFGEEVKHVASANTCFFHDPIGNVRRDSLAEIINGPQAIEFRANLQVAENPICRRCVCSLHRSN